MLYTIALFGEAEKGSFHCPYICEDLVHLDQYLGNPPKNTRGLYYAIQFLMFQYRLIFFRVHEEGYSFPDYFSGFQLLMNQETIAKNLAAIVLPGVGTENIFHAADDVCNLYHSILIANEADLYDYLTN